MTWPLVQLGEVCHLIYGKSLRDYQAESGQEWTARVYGTNGPIGWTKTALTAAPTVVVGRKGAYRGVHYSDGPSWTIDTAYYTEVDAARVDLRWYYYRLLLVDINGMNSGAAIPSTRREDFYSVRLQLPDVSSQRRIAGVLSAYDDLIKNNRKRIALLEEAARLLFREWFVHLRFPGHEHVTVVDGVPAGWVRRSLGDVAECRLGKMLDQNKNKGELMPYLANVNVRWGAIDLDNLREMRFEDDELGTVGLRYGDIVMCEGGEPGRCALWKDQLPGMMIQKAIHRIRAHPEVSYLFLYYCLRHKGQSGQLAPLFTGATIRHLPREKLAIVQVAIPPLPLMTLFAEQVDLLEKEITVLEAANRRAYQARDLLLPRLMSGEIAV